MSWFILVLISVLSESVASVLQRILMKSDKSDPTAYMIVFQFLTAILIGVFVVFRGFHFPANLISLTPNLILMIVLITTASIFMFKALQITQASDYSILKTSSVFWTLITSAIFLKENITWLRIIGTLLIILGVIIISWHRQGRIKLHRGHLYTFISAAAFGLAFANDAYIVRSFDVMSYMVIIFLLPGVSMMLLKPQSIKKMKSLTNITMMLKMSSFCVFYGLSAITIFLAYQAGGAASQIYPISKSAVILTVILAAVLLKEQDRLWQKILGAAAAFIGVLLLR